MAGPTRAKDTTTAKHSEVVSSPRPGLEFAAQPKGPLPWENRTSGAVRPGGACAMPAKSWQWPGYGQSDGRGLGSAWGWPCRRPAVSCLLMGPGAPGCSLEAEQGCDCSLCLPLPAQAWPASRHPALPLPAWRAGAPGLLTHRLGSASRVLGKEAPLGSATHPGGLGGPALAAHFQRPQPRAGGRDPEGG